MSFDGSRDFGPYLRGIARNVMVDRARRNGRELLVPEIQFDEAAASGSDPYPDIMVEWEDPDAIAVARRFIQDLSPDLARVHLVRYVEGLSQREAAAQLGITRQMLRTLEGKLREGLREALRERAEARVRAENRERRDSSPVLR
jgi:RNA polymerase sigma-70 factor (ECF subfamily)